LVADVDLLNGILKQLDQRLNERPHRLPGEFLTQLRQLAEQVDQAALFGAVQAVGHRVEIADQGTGERFPQHPVLVIRPESQHRD